MAVRSNEFRAAELRREAQIAGQAFACDDMPRRDSRAGYLSSTAFWVACAAAAGVGIWVLGLS